MFFSCAVWDSLDVCSSKGISSAYLGEHPGPLLPLRRSNQMISEDLSIPTSVFVIASDVNTPNLY
jgi:hypothetical protein